MKENDESIIEYYAESRNLHPETKRNYTIYLRHYTEYFQMSLKELLDEAEEEEEKGIRWKHRTLKKRLIEYRTHLYNTYAPSTAKSRMTRIQTFYRHHDIEIHPLPKFSTRNLKNTPHVSYTDLPDKEIIRAAVDIATPVMKAIILFMSSSGCGRAETLSLTVEDYIEATKEYHKGGEIQEIIGTVDKIKDVVPTFDVLRRKTNKYYITFCSPEAVHAINTHLLNRNNLTPDSKLFRIHKDYFIEAFENINTKLGLGKVGHYIRFRSHMLRKYHASALMNDGMSRDLVNDLQGRTKPKTDDSYFFTDTDSLKEAYVSHLPALMIGKEIEKITVKSKEFRQLESELKEKNEKVELLFKEFEKLKKSVTWEDVMKEY